jgi:hypothetical protein
MLAIAVWSSLLPQAPAAQVPEYHATRPATLEIRGVHVVKGDGSPPYGPTSLFVSDGVIAAERIASPSRPWCWTAAAAGCCPDS